MSTVTTTIDGRMGEAKERLIDMRCWKGFGPTSVSIAEKGVSGSCCLSLGHRMHSFSEFPKLCMILRPLCIMDVTASTLTHAPQCLLYIFDHTARVVVL